MYRNLKLKVERRFVREMREGWNSSKAHFLFLPLPIPLHSFSWTRSLSPLMAFSCPLVPSSPSKQGLLSFNRARDEIFEIGHTMTTIRLWYALEMNSRANDRFDFRPIYEPHSLVPRISPRRGGKKIGEISNVRTWSI